MGESIVTTRRLERTNNGENTVDVFVSGMCILVNSRDYDTDFRLWCIQKDSYTS